MIDLDELMRLREAATPGPWRHKIASKRDGMGSIWPFSSIKSEDVRAIQEEEEIITSSITSANAAYIVAACNATPELVRRIKELERINEFFVEYLIANDGCPFTRCRYIIQESEYDDWDCPASNPKECWIEAAMASIEDEENGES